MEKEAYKIGVKEGCIESDYPNGAVPMKQIFDLIAGSETGALIASTLLSGDGLVSEAKDIFEYQSDKLYNESGQPFYLTVLISSFFAIYMSIQVFFYFDNNSTDNPDERYSYLQDYIRHQIDELRGKHV